MLLLALAEKRIGRRDQANAWIWRLADTPVRSTRSTRSSAGRRRSGCSACSVNSSGHAHARNARRLVQATRNQDRRLQAAVLAAAVAHTPEAEEVLRGARTRLSRKPGALSRELLRNFPKGKGRRGRRARAPGRGERQRRERERRRQQVVAVEAGENGGAAPKPAKRPSRRRRSTSKSAGGDEAAAA